MRRSCLPSMLVALSLAIVGCSAGPADGPAATTEDRLWGFSTYAFETAEVPVCWEDASPALESERALVRDAVAETWGSLGLVTFVGWDLCTETSQAVRIEVARKGAYAHAFGRHLLGKKNGLTLNFVYGPEFAQGCTLSGIRRSCIYVDAVHEFGHVLGFAHEQHRPDRPATAGCSAAQLTGAFDHGEPLPDSTFGTAYDPDSVMNYCNRRYWDRHLLELGFYSPGRHPWILSEGDRRGMEVMYAHLRR